MNRWEEARDAREKAERLRSEEAEKWYQMARANPETMRGDKDTKLRWLTRAIDLDKGYRELARTDRDFEGLWQDRDFLNTVA